LSLYAVTPKNITTENKKYRDLLNLLCQRLQIPC